MQRNICAFVSVICAYVYLPSTPQSEQVGRPIPRGQRYTSCWPLETSHHTCTVDTRG